MTSRSSSARTSPTLITHSRASTSSSTYATNHGRTTATATPQTVSSRSPMDPSPFHRNHRSIPIDPAESTSLPTSRSSPRIGGPGYFDAEGSMTAQEKHRAQLASYRRNSDAARYGRPGGPLVDRLTALWQATGNLPELAASLAALFGIQRALDGDLGSPGHHSRKSRALNKWTGVASGTVLGRRNRRLLLYIAMTSFLYLFIVRPLLSSSNHPAYPGQQSSGAKATTKRYNSPNVSTRPKSAKHRHGPRAPLPPSVMKGLTTDHPVENGLLKVDITSSSHPIYQLIRDARIEWDAKVDRQSKTLQQAVTEYQRRHKRAPPKGFDKWWKFVVENDVQLPDEYDQIERDILPFRALSPDELRLRNDRASQYPDTYTLKVRKGSVRTAVTFDPKEIYGADERMADQVALLKPIAKYVGDMQAVYSVHDTPSVVVGWGHRRELLEHVEDDEYIDGDDEIDLTGRGWPALCDPSSALRRALRRSGIRAPPPRDDTARTFISSHKATMDICEHPEAVPIHGVLSGKNPQVGDLLPLFSLAKTNLHSDILGIPTESYLDTMDIIPWSERSQNTLLWRGSNTGGHFQEGVPWKDSHRVRLVDTAMRHWGNLTILSPPKHDSNLPLGSRWALHNWEKANEWYTDIAFTGEPIQCEEAACDELRETYSFLEKMTHAEALNYKYVLDVDGNAWSARFQRLLKSGSVIFKSTIMPEWWTDRIQPWIHYVPIQVDYSDLYDALAFFRGTPSNPHSGETALAEEIAHSARDYVETHWRRVDMTAYIFRLYLEWARLLAPRRWEMDFVYAEHMELPRE